MRKALYKIGVLMQNRNMEKRKLSELEACVLGVIWRDGPNTAYQVRMSFSRSLTTSWRASTGSIYPLIRKLKKMGLITERAIPDDPRRAKMLEITENGLAEVKSWVASMPEWIAEPVADTIRTRYHFLSSLPERQRSAVLAAWISHTQEAITHAKAEILHYTEIGDKIDATAHRGMMMQLQARLKWLKSIDDGELTLGK